MSIKICAKCKEEKPATSKYFYNDKKSKKYGLAARCKDCRNSENPVVTGEGNKTCSKCHQTFPADLDHYHYSKREKDGLRSQCKTCRSKAKKIYRDANKERINAQSREYSSRPEVKEKAKRTPEQKRRRNIIERKRWREDEHYRTYLNLCNGLNSMLAGKAKTCRTMQYVGCSIEELVDHLNESRPDTDEPLHIDHIIPKSLYNLTEKDLCRCWNYANLRLIPASQNLAKSDNLDMDLVRKHNIEDLLP